ncbi:MAG: 4'-phosphopantetheinyl transferase superfamily protein [Clostridia bacterium]|nr:4'-phosphopantetheinyl transferase superfamily protein [Clostridia bacterium]
MIKIYLFNYNADTDTDDLIRRVIPGARIVREKGKKPRLESPIGVHFSLSHSYDLCAVAVAERPVGVDIEKVREVKGAERIAKKYYSPAERETDFLQVWVRKESRVKRDGTGMAAISPECASTGSDIIELDLPKGYVGALCCDGAADGNIQVHRMR